MELHDLISSNQLNDFNESAIDVPDSYFDPIHIKMGKKGKFKFDTTSFGCYVNNAFMSNDCIMDNHLNNSKETCFGGKFNLIK